MTQKELIVDYIKRFGSISPIEAFSDCGITKLSTRVSEMKKDGVLFDTKMESYRNRYGKTVRYARYRLVSV